MKEQILYYAIKYQGEWHKIKKALDQQEEWEKISYDGNYVTIFDEAYPSVLRNLRYAPWILFYEGNYNLLQKPAIAVVGGRVYDDYGEQQCKHVVSIIKQNYVIVSGMAKGIDAIAHTTALDHFSIGVIGCGLDIVYPKENAQLYAWMKTKQLLISEYPKGSKPLAYHFPWRNRILAALSKGIVVIQARKRSGTMLTVNEGLELGIPIYCIPHRFQEPLGEGCNHLILQGAQILIEDQDIYEI